MSATITECRRLFIDEANISVGTGDETIQYLVTVAERTATPLEVAFATWTPTATFPTPMPQLREFHPIVGGLMVSNKSAKRAPGTDGRPSMFNWVVTVVYGAIQLVGTSENSSYITITVSGQEETILSQVDRGDEDDGSLDVPVLNALGDLYPDPFELTEYDEKIEISFETTAINGGLIASARGKLNDSDISINIPQGTLTYSRTFPAYTVRLKTADYGATVSRANPNVHVWRVVIVLLIRTAGWQLMLPEKGYRWLTRDADGNPVGTAEFQDHPEYLDADGYKLADGAQLVAVNDGEGVQRYRATDLAGLLSTI